VSTDQQVTSVVSACQSCHGVGFGGGTVNGEVAPRLRGQSAPYTQQTLVAMTSGERANNDTMTVIAKSLDGAQIEPIAQYLAALGN
jgi:cytochrome c553